ncbi:hypothetical protein [Pseudomonas sp. Pseusp16]|uniref:hypothetical protein n=1 Tax=Pseudomonas sp. Pseusp16 TaxID=3243021 RepID=UPI0039B619AA
MTIESLHAATQYSDYKGGAAADRADGVAPAEWLRQKGHINNSEFLVGIDFSVGENHGVHRDPVHVTFLIFDAGSYDTVAEHIASLPVDEPVPVRRVSLELTLAEFFALFKRVNVTLTPLEVMQGRAYSYAD